MNKGEQKFHAQDMYPTQDTSRTGTARMKQEEDADTRIIEVKNREEKNVGRKRKNPKQGLTIILPEGSASLYHRWNTLYYYIIAKPLLLAYAINVVVGKYNT